MTINATAKVAAVAAGLAMASSMLSFATFAHAADACSVGMTDLTVGSTGDAVKCLQETLIAGKYLVMPAGATTGTFGPLTKAAVMKWQAEKGITPAAGYFGPKSRAAFTGVAGGTTGSCATPFDPITGKPCGTTTPTTPASLSGTDGSISDVNNLGSVNNEDVAEGNNGVKVYGADVEVSKDGDIALKSVKVVFDPAGNSGSTRLNRYISKVDVMLGSTKIGSASADDFSKNSDGTYSKTITLSGNTTIKADTTGKLYVAVDAVSTIDSGDISGDSWTVAVDNIRFVDGSGVYTTEDGYDLGTGVSINFVDYGTAADTDLKISTASDTPSEGIVVVDDTANTDNVSLLKGKIKLDGKSDVLMDQFPVTFTTTSGANLAAVMSNATLKIDGKEFSESNISSSLTTATVTFDNLDLSINAGDTVTFEVLADINDIDAGNFDEGDTLKADVTATNRNYIDAENDQGDQLSDSSEKHGTATGKDQQFRTNGIGVSFVSAATSVAAGTSTNDDQGTFTLKFKVTAIGDTMYVSSLVDAVASLTSVTTGKTSVHFERAGVATNGGTSVALSNLTDDTLNSAGLFQIEEGDSETFELTGTAQLPTVGSSGLYRMVLNGVSWTTDGTDATPDNQYTSTNANLDSFKTSYVGLN